MGINTVRIETLNLTFTRLPWTIRSAVYKQMSIIVCVSYVYIMCCLNGVIALCSYSIIREVREKYYRKISCFDLLLYAFYSL